MRPVSTAIFKGHSGIGDRAVTGETLVASDDFSARYDLDRQAGVFSRPSHKLFGKSYVNKVLVLNAAKGGVASAWMLRDMVDREIAPLALLLNYANPILAQGAAFASLPLVDRFDVDITLMLRSGMRVEVDARAGCVRVID